MPFFGIHCSVDLLRRRDRTERTVGDTQICAFELLASLAGKLLEESESSASSNAFEGRNHVSINKDVVKQEIQYDDKLLKTECIEHVSCVASVVDSDGTTENNDNLKEFKHSENHAILERTLTKMQPAYSKQTNLDLKSAIRKHNVAYESFTAREAKGLESGALAIANNCPLKDPLDLSMTFLAPVNSHRDVKLCNKLSNRFKASRPPTHIEDQRIRKLLMSKYWKAAPKLKDFEHCRADGGIKSLHRKRKTCYNYDNCQNDTLYKRMKFFDRNLIVTSDEVIGNGSVSNLPEKHVRCPPCLQVTKHPTSLMILMIIWMHTLEPGPVIAPPPLCYEEPPLLLPCGAAPQNLTSSLTTPVLYTKIPDATADPPLLTNSAKAMDSNYKHTSSQTDMLTDQKLSESRALVPVPAMNVEVLAVVPTNHKIRKSELARRRTRRPFSVSEVEALVRAVEELGTGRWRDVKLQAFENVDHRTYVDLKDKWKTLVHRSKDGESRYPKNCWTGSWLLMLTGLSIKQNKASIILEVGELQTLKLTEMELW
ncbi:hypothetical protein GQ457_08G010920 [Hibiscus cannabinus]